MTEYVGMFAVTLNTYEAVVADRDELLRLGAALASTGGQQGFDEALDAWNNYLGNR